VRVLRQDTIKIDETGSITFKSRKQSNDVGLQLQNPPMHKGTKTNNNKHEVVTPGRNRLRKLLQN